ncbi:MAG: hypothetical protein M1828_003558 [Chrysothrix sp. TS-e1954]|nr:MAG: hypothetical protein M1828_003558 [Chrysothrix sp. TS-e1954]
MAVSYTFGTFVATVVAIVVAAFVFRQIVIPACIYIIEYYRNGQKAAEDKALDSMGENRLSYGLKDQMKRNRVIDDPNVNKFQDQAADAVGGLTGKDGMLGGVGGVVSDIGGDAQEESRNAP